MLIEVQKLVAVEKKDSNGALVFEPQTKKPLIESYNCFRETINEDEIKSARPWQKNAQQALKVDGDITILYLKGDTKKSAPAQMLINENHDDFSKRVKSIQLNG